MVVGVFWGTVERTELRLKHNKQYRYFPLQNESHKKTLRHAVDRT